MLETSSDAEVEVLFALGPRSPIVVETKVMGLADLESVGRVLYLRGRM
jgi:hypothetical protein